KVVAVCTEPPLVYTPIRAEREASVRHLQAAPAAQGPAVIPFGKSAAVGESARHGSGTAARERHNIFRIECLGPVVRGAEQIRSEYEILPQFGCGLIDAPGEFRQMAGGDPWKDVVLDMPEHVEGHSIFDPVTQRPRNIVGPVAMMMNRPNREECGQALSDA